MKAQAVCIALVVVLVVLIALGIPAMGQTISLDDRGVMPLHPGSSPGVGKGAEDEFGKSASGVSALAASPSLALFPQSPLVVKGDGALFSPGVPVNRFMNPNGGGLDAFSTNHAVPSPETPIHLDFSVDRKTTGVSGSALLTEAGFNQHMGDIFGSTRTFANPIGFVGNLGPTGTILPTANVGGSNTLLINQGLASPGVPGLGLATGMQGSVPIVLAAGVMAPQVGPGTHDNVDAFDYASLVPDPNGPGPGGVINGYSYFCINHNEASTTGYAMKPADIFVVAPNQPIGLMAPWATATSIGLNAFEDSIDALVVFDRAGEGGVAQSRHDFALFSLAPGSLALSALNLDAADIFLTDFNGTFAVYARPGDLGIVSAAGGAPFAGSNIDALEIRAVPEPSTLALLATGLLACCLRRRKRKA